MRFFTTILLLFFIFENISLNAQQWLGIAGSNYAGTYSVANNPANVVDSRYKVFVNLVGNDLFVFNNYVSWNAPYSILALSTQTTSAEYRAANGNTIWKDSYLNENNNDTPKNAHILGDLKGPSILFNLNSQNSIALSSRVRYGATIDNASPILAKLIRNGFEQPDLLNIPVKNENFAFNVNAYLELGVTYGRILINDAENFIKVGITAKRLVGMYNAHALVNQADYQLVKNDPNDLTKRAVSVDNIQTTYGGTANGALSQIKLTPAWVFGNTSAGGGWAGDIGIVYEFRPNARKFLYTNKGVRQFDPAKNKYEWKIGVSLIDVGYLKYDNASLVTHYTISRKNETIAASNYSNVTNTTQAINATNATLQATDNEKVNNYFVGIPTHFQVNFDYHIQDNFYANALWVQGVKSANAIGMTMPSLLSVTPRYETPWFEAALPVALLNNYQKLTMGLSFRVGPLLLGTDHLGSWIGIGHPQGMDVYFGLFVPIMYATPKSANACWYEEKPFKRRKGRR